jgi:hypothetical protein
VDEGVPGSAVGLTKAQIVGRSMGGAIAQIVAIQRPDLTFFDLECHALKRCDSAELNMYVFERENCVTHALSSLS